MEKTATLIQADLNEIRSKVNPDFKGDLTMKFVCDMLVTVRRLKTRLEVLWAEMEKD